MSYFYRNTYINPLLSTTYFSDFQSTACRLSVETRGNKLFDKIYLSVKTKSFAEKLSNESKMQGESRFSRNDDSNHVGSVVHFFLLPQLLRLNGENKATKF